MIVVDQVLFGGVNMLTAWFHALLCSLTSLGTYRAPTVWEEFLVLEKNLLFGSVFYSYLHSALDRQHKGKQQETQ